MGKVKVSNGTETLEIDSNDLNAAVKDGYKPTERIIVANSKTKESYEIDPADIQGALDEGFSFQDIVKKKQGGGLSPSESKSALPAEPATEPPKDILTLSHERRKLLQGMSSQDRRTQVFYGDTEQQQTDEKALSGLNQQIKDLGGDDEFADDISDLPAGEGFSFTKSIPGLMQLKKENPFQYKRAVAAMKSKGELHNAIAKSSDVENAKFLVQQLQNTEKENYQEGTRAAINLTRQFVNDTDEQNRIIKNIVQDKSYDYGLQPIDEEWLEKNPNLNPYQARAMRFLSDVDPATASAYSRILSQNPDDQWLGTTENDVRRGHEMKGKELENIGMNLQMKAIEERLTTLKKKVDEGGQLDEAEQQEYHTRLQEYQTMAEDKKKQNERYPGIAAIEADRLMQESLGSTNSIGKKFALGIGENVDDAVNWVGDLLQDRGVLGDLELLGDKELSGAMRYTPESDKLIGSDIVARADEDLQKQIDAVKNSTLSDEQKRDKVRELYMKNGDKVNFVANDKAGKTNFTSKAIFSTVGDVAADLVSQLAIASISGGAGASTKLGQLSSLFGTTFATAYDDYYTDALKQNIANPTQYALVHTTIEAASELITNDFELAKRMIGKNGTLGNVLNNVSKAQWDGIAKKGTFAKLKDAALQTGRTSLTNTLQETKEEVAGQVAGNIADAQLFGKEMGVGDGVKDTMIQTFVGMLPLGLISLPFNYKNINRTQKYAMYEAGMNPDKFIQAIDKGLAEGLITEADATAQKENIKRAAQAVQSSPGIKTDGSPLTDNEKTEYAFNQSVLQEIKDQKKNAPPEVKEKLEKEEEKINKEQAKILKPRIRVQVGKPAEEKTESVTPQVEQKIKPVQKIEEFDTELDNILNQPQGQKIETGINEALPKIGEEKQQSNIRPKDEDITVYKDPKNIIAKAKEFYGDDPLINRVADFLQPIIEANPNIRVDTDAKVQEGVLGYSYGDGRVELNFDQIQDYDTLYRTGLHELVHAATRGEISKNTAFREDLQSVLDDVRTAMGVPKDSSIISAFVARGIIDENKYGAANEHEMLAEVFSNQKFYEELKGMEYKGDNMLHRLFLAIAKYFSQQYKQLAGAKAEINADNIADYLMQLSESIVGGKQQMGEGGALPALKNDPKTKAIKDLIERSRNIPAEQLKKSLKEKAGLSDEDIDMLMQPKRGIRHEDTANIRTQQGLPAYEGKSDAPDAIEKWTREAEQKLQEGYDVEDLLNRMEKGEFPDKIEQRILDIHVNDLNTQLLNNPSADLLNRLRRAVDLSDKVGGTLVAQSLVSRRNMGGLKEGSLGEFLLQKEKAIGTSSLTQEEIDEQKKKYDELKQAHDDLQKSVEQLKQDHAKLLIEKEKKSVKGGPKTDYKQVRKDAVSAARAALKKLRTGQSGLSAVPLPGVREFIAIAPHVKTYVKALVHDGVERLETIIENAYDEFKELIDGISKTDIRDIIAGEYDEARTPTINQAAETLRNLKTEASLLKQIEEAKLGIEKEKNTKERKNKSRRIIELEARLREVQRWNKIQDEMDEGVEDTGGKSQEEQLAAKKKSLLNRIEKLEAEIKSGKFKKPVEKAPLKMDAKTRKLQDRVIELERQRQIELAKDEYAKLSKWQKAWDKFMQVIGIRRIVQTAVDFSIVLRQGVVIAMNPRRWGIAKAALIVMFKSVFSPKNFNRQMYELRHSEYYHDMVKDGVRFNDLDAVDPIKRNEDFQKSFIYKIPFLREPLLASNRAADAFLNTARYELYMRGLRMLGKQGITRQNNVKEYEALAKWAMNTTGSGSMIKWMEDSHGLQRFLGSTFFGARLMASRFNLLNPYYYVKMPPQVRKQALYDMGTFVAMTMVTGLALAAAGAKISFDPDDPDFLKVRFGDTVYDITGGLALYVRTYLRIAEAAYARAFESKHEGLERVDNAKKSTFSFFTNKLAPNTSYAWSAITGKKGTGQDFDPYDILRVYPMYTDDMIDGWKKDGALSLATIVLPSIFGIGVQTYPTQGGGQDLETLIERNVRSEDQDFEKMVAYDEEDKERPLTDKEVGDYIKKRDEKIKTEIEKLYTQGADMIVDEEPKTVPFKELNKDQVIEELSKIKAKATRETKEELFPVPDSVEKKKRRQKKELEKYKRRKDD